MALGVRPIISRPRTGSVTVSSQRRWPVTVSSPTPSHELGVGVPHLLPVLLEPGSNFLLQKAPFHITPLQPESQPAIMSTPSQQPQKPVGTTAAAMSHHLASLVVAVWLNLVHIVGDFIPSEGGTVQPCPYSETDGTAAALCCQVNFPKLSWHMVALYRMRV